MRGRGRVLHVVAGVLLAALAAGPAVAAGPTTVTEQLIRDLNAQLLAVAIPITLVVEGILVYTVWQFRETDDAKPTRENRQLEITWTVATAVVLLFVGYASFGVMANEFVVTAGESIEVTGDENPVVVRAVGNQWFWSFEYPNESIEPQERMVVPVDRPLVIRTTSNDVIHAFHVPAMGLKADAIPGQTNAIRTVPLETGTYTLYCAEYCGAGHSRMLANVTVVDQDAYRRWVEDPANASV